MKSKRLHADGGGTTWAIVLDRGDEAVAVLSAFAREQGITAAHFTAIGAFRAAVLGYFDRERKDYTRIPIDELHAHAVLGRSDGSARGGHLLEGHVWPTLEVVLQQSPRHLRKKLDPAVGLALIDLDAA